MLSTKIHLRSQGKTNQLRIYIDILALFISKNLYYPGISEGQDSFNPKGKALLRYSIAEHIHFCQKYQIIYQVPVLLLHSKLDSCPGCPLKESYTQRYRISLVTKPSKIYKDYKHMYCRFYLRNNIHLLQRLTERQSFQESARPKGVLSINPCTSLSVWKSVSQLPTVRSNLVLAQPPTRVISAKSPLFAIFRSRVRNIFSYYQLRASIIVTVSGKSTSSLVSESERGSSTLVLGYNASTVVGLASKESNGL